MEMFSRLFNENTVKMNDSDVTLDWRDRIGNIDNNLEVKIEINKMLIIKK